MYNNVKRYTGGDNMNSTSSYIYVHRGIKTRIMAMADGIFRITRTRREDFLNAESPVVICQPSCESALREDDACAVLTSGNVEAHVEKSTGSITFRTTAGDVLLREPARRPCLLQDKTRKTKNGPRPFFIYLTFRRRIPLLRRQRRSKRRCAQGRGA